jgi:hypothetical protein
MTTYHLPRHMKDSVHGKTSVCIKNVMMLERQEKLVDGVARR